MNGTFFDIKENVYQIRIGDVMLVMWKTYRWHIVLYIGKARYALK